MIKNSPLGVSSVNRSKISPETAIGNSSLGVSNVVSLITLSKTALNGRRNRRQNHPRNRAGNRLGTVLAGCFLRQC